MHYCSERGLWAGGARCGFGRVGGMRSWLRGELDTFGFIAGAVVHGWLYNQ